MPKPKGIKWRYVGIPENLLNRIDQIVSADHYPDGKWHSRDHYVVDRLKEAVEQDRKTEDKT